MDIALSADALLNTTKKQKWVDAQILNVIGKKNQIGAENERQHKRNQGAAGKGNSMYY